MVRRTAQRRRRPASGCTRLRWLTSDVAADRGPQLPRLCHWVHPGPTRDVARGNAVANSDSRSVVDVLANAAACTVTRVASRWRGLFEWPHRRPGLLLYAQPFSDRRWPLSRDSGPDRFRV